MAVSVTAGVQSVEVEKASQDGGGVMKGSHVGPLIRCPLTAIMTDNVLKTWSRRASTWRRQGRGLFHDINDG